MELKQEKEKRFFESNKFLPLCLELDLRLDDDQDQFYSFSFYYIFINFL